MTNEKVRESMTPAPTTVEASEDVVEAARRMASEDVGSLPVVADGELVGMVTDRDLVLQVLARTPTHTRRVSAPSAPRTRSSSASRTRSTRPSSGWRASAFGAAGRVEDRQLVGILAQADVSRAADAEATGRLVEEIFEG